MSSIALPALGIHPVQSEDPLAAYGKVASLQGMLQQRQSQTLQLQQQQQALKDQQATTAAMKSWDGKSYDDLSQSVLKNGGSANAALTIAQHGQQIKKTASDIAKDDAETGKTNLATTIEKNNQVLGAIDAAKGVPDDQLGQHLTQTAQNLVQQGLLDPQHAQAVQQLAQQPPQQMRGALDVLEKSLMGQKEQFEQAQKTQNTAIEQEKADTAQWKEAGQGTLVNTKTGAMIHGFPPVDQSELQDFLKKNPGKGPWDFAKAKAALSPQAQINVQGGPPNDALVQAVANNSMKIGDVLTPRTPLPVRKQFLNAVLQTNPQFKSSDYDIEKGVMKDFTSGPDSQKLQAFNTAITHMGVFKQAADALDNGDVKVLNQAGNTLGTQFGSDKATNFTIAKQAFIGEVARAFDGAGVTMHDREQIEQQVSAASSPAQLKGAADTAEKLLRGKRDVLKQQFTTGSNAQPNFGDQPNASSNSAPEKPKSKAAKWGVEIQ